jgi:hypothetical protein
MKDVVEVDALLYQTPSTLWVEDPLTRVFLKELWNDPDITMRTGGGRAGVEYLVENGPSKLVGTAILGLVDRDFSVPQAWGESNKPILFTQAHEFENHLLEFAVFARLSRQRSADEIQQIAAEHASKLVWWMACKRVIRDLQMAHNENFPSDPPMAPAVQAPTDAESAARHIFESTPFWNQRPKKLHIWDKSRVHSSLVEYANIYSRDLETGGWVTEFSGKEILRHVRSHVPGIDKPNNTSTSQRDEDFARRIARMMRERNEIPTVFNELHKTLRSRAGLA